MTKDKTPMTPAVRALRAAGIAFEEHPYKYVEHGGKRGFLVGLSPQDLVRVLNPIPVRVAIP